MKAAIIVLAVAASVGCHALAEESFPPDVQKLVDQRVTAIARIDQTFVQELGKLKTRYMQQGNLEAANQIDTLIKLHGPDPSTGRTDSGAAVNRFVGQWWLREANALRKGKVTITDTHMIEEGNGKRHPYSVEGRGIRIHWASTQHQWILFTPQAGDEGSVKGINHEGTRYELQRIPAP